MFLGFGPYANDVMLHAFFCTLLSVVLWKGYNILFRDSSICSQTIKQSKQRISTKSDVMTSGLGKETKEMRLGGIYRWLKRYSTMSLARPGMHRHFLVILLYMLHMTLYILYQYLIIKMENLSLC